MNVALAKELEYRATQGRYPITVKELNKQLRKLGYKLNRSMDCRSCAQWLSGPRGGKSYPVITTDIIEIDTGFSFSNVPLARRDTNFNELQKLRRSGELFSVLRDSILEI